MRLGQLLDGAREQYLELVKNVVEIILITLWLRGLQVVGVNLTGGAILHNQSGILFEFFQVSGRARITKSFGFFDRSSLLSFIFRDIFASFSKFCLADVRAAQLLQAKEIHVGHMRVCVHLICAI